jgi:hypothetical protein
MMSQFNDGLDKPDDNTPAGLAIRWNKEIEAAGKEVLKWHDDSKKINKRYLDQRDGFESAESRVNLFWSTIETMKASLYARPPKADVARSNYDAEDDGARVAATMLERILNSGLEEDGSDFDAALRHGISDWLIVGLGQLWFRYEVETEMVMVPAIVHPHSLEEIEPAAEFEKITSEEVQTDYIYWGDFFWSPARTWEEVRWVGRRTYLVKEKAEKRFGKVIAAQLNYAKKPKTKEGGHDGLPQNEPWDRAEVFEIWSKDDKKVYWYAKGVDVVLDVKDDPLGLDDFFPCPKPAMMNTTTSNMMPRALYVFAQDQFDELDVINTRIKYLTEACKVTGVYDKSAEGVQKLFTEGVENRLIPVDNWAMFAEKGGIKGQIEFVPIEMIAKAIEYLRMQRGDKTQQIYEVLGISDIMRGSSKASETATAQQIKAQFGSTRLQYYQFELARWVRHALRIKAEIIATHFQPDTIVKMSNIQYTSDKEHIPAALEVISQMGMEQYRVNVDADTMAAVDWAQKKEDSADLLNAIGNFVAQMTPVIQGVPGSAPFVLQMMQAMLAGVKGAKAVESILDHAIAAASKPPEPPQPSPEQIAEVENTKAQTMERQAKAKKLAAETQVLASEDPHMEMQMRGQEAQQKMQMQGAQAQQKMQIDQAMAEQKMSADAQKSEQAMMHQIVKDRHDMAVARIQAQNKVMQQPNPNMPAAKGAGVSGQKPSVG